MSWRSGAALFTELWPLVKEHIPQGNIRKEFTVDLLNIFERWDVDRANLRGVDPELDVALAVEGHDEPRGANCISWCLDGLSDDDPGTRVLCAQAISYIVERADGVLSPQAAKALAAACAREQSDEFVLAALKSLRELVWKYQLASIDPSIIEPLARSSHTEIAERAAYLLRDLARFGRS